MLVRDSNFIEWSFSKAFDLILSELKPDPDSGRNQSYFLNLFSEPRSGKDETRQL